jgi:hypothetical protein
MGKGGSGFEEGRKGPALSGHLASGLPVLERRCGHQAATPAAEY